MLFGPQSEALFATMEFPALLQRLDALLQRHRPAYYATLEPPAAADEIAAFEAEFRLTLPAELRLWWGWRNGQRGFDSLIEYRSPQSVSGAAATMRVNCELLADGDFAPNWWRPAWVPLLENGGGDHLCLDLEGTFTSRPGQLLEHWHDGPERAVLFPDLTAWLAAVVAAYEKAYGDGRPLSDEEFADIELEYPAGFPQEFEADGEASDPDA